MASANCEKFLQSCQSKTDDYDFQKQMLWYCRKDVQACMKSCQLLLGITGELEEMDLETLEVKRGIEN